MYGFWKQRTINMPVPKTAMKICEISCLDCQLTKRFKFTDHYTRQTVEFHSFSDKKYVNIILFLHFTIFNIIRVPRQACLLNCNLLTFTKKLITFLCCVYVLMLLTQHRVTAVSTFQLTDVASTRHSALPDHSLLNSPFIRVSAVCIFYDCIVYLRI